MTPHEGDEVGMSGKAMTMCANFNCELKKPVATKGMSIEVEAILVESLQQAGITYQEYLDQVASLQA